MPIKISFDENDLKDFETFVTLGDEKIRQIIDIIKDLPKRPLKPLDIQNAIEKILSDNLVEVDKFIKNLLCLYNLKGKLNIDPKELLDSLYYSIKNAEKPWSDEKIRKWKDLEPVLLTLFSLSEILYVVKALSLSYDYDNLSQNIKILTDIRPVYNEDAKEIIGVVISHTLRLYYQRLEGPKSISIALDNEDVSMLLKSCERALTKADTAKRLMKEEAKKETLICGEEGH